MTGAVMQKVKMQKEKVKKSFGILPVNQPLTTILKTENRLLPTAD